MKKNKISLFTHNKARLFVLFLALFVINGHFYLRYYENVMEVLKHIPIPVINCYSTPSTVFACPVGLLQHFIAIGTFTFATMGILIIFGALIGRWTCGWLCPFGFLQEFIYHAPIKKISIPRWTGIFKYLVLFGLVILAPRFITNELGLADTWFCKVCPVGCLEAGIPVPIVRPDIRYLIGTMYWIKIVILFVTVLIPSLFIKRPFCSVFCPLGAFYGMFNNISLLKLKFNKNKCNSCGLCKRECPIGLDPTKDYGSPDCILCMNCTKEFCNAITPHFTLKNIKEKL